ncbi:alpha/beta fold hydrolase [Intrasporangium calvum]|uniref:2-hydroxymuconate semialdehyde hydrolase n=1 Tax=Intrasporangium calvum (strain ATCC 23552 / DSM 43043 / JCM 3097 / NBRC 12989 / NCIMB 10167 / NRRL B-3866 / 7 KIP) TaxID=710696 RepID=E6SDZ8_INTC7|nr:alpha/beta hydrolase [Intrasporangium calvum]ADU47611.1 2-hydroxymuconate semialdehyde hydrolase [Intrasporangium calvum DSM 43043]
MTEPSPLGGEILDVAGVPTWVHDVGDGPVVLLLHGSGPGVSAAANWRLTIPALVAAGHRVIAPDQLGFGRTVPPEGHEYSVDSWLAHAVALLDVLGVERASVVGNSFGGAMALRLASQHADRVDRLVLMGSVGVPFPITEGLDAVWGYEPSVDNMRALLDLFAHDTSRMTDDLARDRYEASVKDGADERFAAMFPAPRQRWVDSMVLPMDEIRSISAPTLLFHGREDQVIPFTTSLNLFHLIEQSQLHVFGQCGHWTQIEYADDFNALLARFLA